MKQDTNVTIFDALQKLGTLIDEAIQKIYIWESSPDETRKALRGLMHTKERIEGYLRSHAPERKP